MSQEAASVVPWLSVVVAQISGRPEHLEACLASLTAQVAPPRMEIIVACDTRIGDVARFQGLFPSVQFLPPKRIPRAALSGWNREHHDELRALGLRHARGDIIALIQDDCIPCSRWCATLVKEHAAPHAAVGGAIENRPTGLLNWAIYFCDFGRYQNPVRRGPAPYVSDCNIAYKRRALEQTAELWKDAYHEASINRALQEAGETLWLSPDVVVWQHREKMGLTTALRERYVWARSYAGTRVAEAEPGKRFFYTSFALVLPLLMLGRAIVTILRKQRNVSRFILAFPLMVLLTVVWSWGEFIGYLTGRAAVDPKYG